MAAPTLTNWDLLLAQKLGIAPTPEVIKFLHNWTAAEGGGASNNPFNTTQPGFGSVGDYNSSGVKNYATPMGGINATVATLNNGRYGNILQAMRNGSSAMAMAQALQASPWGTGGLVVKMLGGPASGGLPAASSPTQSPRKAGAPASQTLPGAGAPALGKPAVGTTLQTLLNNAAPSDLTLQLIGQNNPQMASMLSRLQQPIQLPKMKQTPAIPISVPNSDGGKVNVHGANPHDPVANGAVNLVRQYLGTPYVWGGAKPGGFDCSGLLQYVWAKEGINIPRTTYDQWGSGTPVGTSQLRPGDAVFFRGSDSIKRGGQVLPGHVGMYIGNGQFIEAPHTGANVRISTLQGRTDFMGARRFA